MKKLSITFSNALVILISLSSFSFAQSDKRKYKLGCSLAINSIQAQIAIPLMTIAGEVIIDADGNITTKGKRKDHSISYSIVPKYYIKDDILLRFEFGITNLNLKAYYEYLAPPPVNGFYTYSTEVENKIYRYAPGFQWFFLKEKRIESYCGMTVSYIDYKSLNYYYYSEDINVAANTLRSYNDITESTPGGFATGVGAFAGFNIYLMKNISLGAELSSSAMYYKLGGETTHILTEFNVSGPDPAVTYNLSYPNSYEGFKISKITASFNISVRF